MGIPPRAIWFFIGLGAVVFVLIANLNVTSQGYDCGSVMSGKSYSGHSASEFSSLDPGGSLGSSFTDSAAAASEMKATGVNFACDSARSSRRTFAILMGVAVAVVGIGAMRLRKPPAPPTAPGDQIS